MGHTVLLSNAQKCPRCPKSSQQRTFPFSLLINKYSSCCFNALLRSITMIEQKDGHGIGWNAECGLCVQVYRASNADFCSSPTLPSLLQSCNTTTSRLFPKHGNTRRCLQTQTGDKIGLGQVWSGLFRLDQPWSALVRFGQAWSGGGRCVACSLHPAVWILASRKNEASVLTNTGALS